VSGKTVFCVPCREFVLFFVVSKRFYTDAVSRPDWLDGRGDALRSRSLSQFDMYVAEGKFVSIADMDGFALDVDRIREMIAKVLPGMDVSCAARFGRGIFEVGRRKKPNTPTAFSRIDVPIAATRIRRRIGGAVSNISQPRRRDESAAYQRGSTVITVQKRWQRL
jgi:hypothetical protein